MTIKVDFKRDLKAILLANIKKGGFHFNSKLSVEDVARQYFNLRIRTIEPRPRKTHVSRELCVRKLEPEVRKAIEMVSRHSEAGINLISHMSDRILDPNYNDALLFDWGMHHFHLGLDVSHKAVFFRRTNELLFVKATDSDLYLVDVLDHNPHEGFANKRLLEIVYENWPHLLSPFRLVGIKPGTELTNAQIDTIRQRGISTAYAMKDGTVYMSCGGGYASNGSNIWVTRSVGMLLAHISNGERGLLQSEDEIRHKISSQCGRCPKTLTIRLHSWDQQAISAVETKTRQMIRANFQGAAQAIPNHA